MSLTTIVILTVFLVGAFMTLRNPFYGVLLYVFEWHNHPPYWWWGNDLPDPRWSLSIAILMLVSTVINHGKLPKLVNHNYNTTLWLFLFALNALFVSGFFAIVPDESFSKAIELLKIAINFSLMMFLIRRPKDYRWVVLVMLVCVANFGRVAWEEGSNRDLGIMAPNATGGNPIAAHVMTALPFFGVYFLIANRYVKALAVIAMPFALNLLILENSRAALVGVGMIALFSLVYMKGTVRVKIIGALVLGGFLFFSLTNEQYWERQVTTLNPTEEGSAASRFDLWSGAFELWKEKPFGAGGEGFETVSMQYVETIRSPKSQHNTYVAVFSDWGIIGIAALFRISVRHLSDSR